MRDSHRHDEYANRANHLRSAMQGNDSKQVRAAACEVINAFADRDWTPGAHGSIVIPASERERNDLYAAFDALGFRSDQFNEGWYSFIIRDSARDKIVELIAADAPSLDSRVRDMLESGMEPGAGKKETAFVKLYDKLMDISLERASKPVEAHDLAVEMLNHFFNYREIEERGGDLRVPVRGFTESDALYRSLKILGVRHAYLFEEPGHVVINAGGREQLAALVQNECWEREAYTQHLDTRLLEIFAHAAGVNLEATQRAAIL